MKTNTPCTLRLDVSQVIHSRFEGVGIGWDPYHYYPLAEEEWSLLLERVDFLRPRKIRLMVHPYFYIQAVRPSGEVVCDFASPKMQAAYRILAYCQLRGIDVIFGDWNPPDRYGLPLEVDSLPWVRTIGAMLAYLIRERKFTCITKYNFINEPNGSWHTFGFGQWSRGLSLLGEQLRVRGLYPQLSLIGPDTIGFDPVWLSDTVAAHRNRIPAYDVHLYTRLEHVMDGSLAATLAELRQAIPPNDPRGANKRVYVTEMGLTDWPGNGDQQLGVKNFVYGIGMAAFFAHIAGAGLSGCYGWHMDDAAHLNYIEDCRGNPIGEFRYPEVPDANTLKVWGFWNSLAGRMDGEARADSSIRPWFYVWSLLSRLFSGDGKVIDAGFSGENGGMLAVAVLLTREDGGQDLSFLVVNPAASPRRLKIEIAGLADAVQFGKFVYAEEWRPTDVRGFPRLAETVRFVHPAAGVLQEIPAASVLFYSTAEGGRPVTVGRDHIRKILPESKY